MCGYSFGACVAVEMALQLEKSGLSIESLFLLDGSHAYVAAHTNQHKERMTPGQNNEAESEALCAFMLALNTPINYVQVKLFWWF